MTPATILLKAYYETLYHRLTADRSRLVERVEQLLSEHFRNRTLPELHPCKYEAYREACLAFIEERIEMYNPFGIQYTFDRVNSKEVFELELQLDWFDSRAEFEALLQAARDLAQPDMTDEQLPTLVDQLIKRFGAFPQASIIAAYNAAPACHKLPDYIVASAIAELLS